MGITVEPFTAGHARRARSAHREFGRGSGHPARLNVGDCLAYAFAVAENEPLLFTGDDFPHTGVRDARAEAADAASASREGRGT